MNRRLFNYEPMETHHQNILKICSKSNSKAAYLSQIFLYFTDIGYQLITNYLKIKAECFENIKTGKILSPTPPLSTRLVPSLIWIFSPVSSFVC